MKKFRWVTILTLTCLLTIGSHAWLIASVTDKHDSPFLPGHVFAGVGEGMIYHYDASGNLLGTLNTGLGKHATTGCAFDSVGNLYVTTFNAGTVTKFKGPDTPHDNVGLFGSDYNGSPESIVFDTDGNVYVGSVNGDGDIRKFDPDGKPIAQYDVAIEDRGSDWIDLASDQKTMFYSSEGKRILRYDLNDKKQLPDFASSLSGAHAYALRILPDGGILVADTESILRLDATGTVTKTYDVAGEDTWFSLNLDPDGRSFWAGNFGTGTLYKFDIEAGGNPLLTLDTGVGQDRLFGICVYSEITIAIQDADGDGLLDEWEENGFDFNNDSTIDVDLPNMGANKEHKDVFVQVDWLQTDGTLGHSHHIGDSLDKITKSFADAPVSNPDGNTGITLHVVFGKAIKETNETVELGSVPDGCNYLWDEFSTLKQQNFPSNRWPIFHYAILAHNLPAFNCGTFIGRPSGISRNGMNFETGGSDFIVALSDWEVLPSPFLTNIRAGTFMHELGHNLGLGHGGLEISANGQVIAANHINYKPNHLSVMNYSFQTRGLRKKVLFGIYGEGNMDYSRFGSDVLPDINENALSEADGMTAGDPAKDYGTRYYCQGTGGTKTLDGLQLAVDWNCDGDKSDSNLSTSVNNDTTLEILTSANEWEHLVYDGGAVGALGALPELPQTTSMVESPEITFEEDSQIGPFEADFQLFLPVISSQ